MLACAKNNLNVIQSLIGYGSQVQLLNKDGWNCLHIAVRWQIFIIYFGNLYKKSL